MPLRPLAILSAFSVVSESATASELGTAFQAPFGQPAPATRHIERPIYDTDQYKVVGHDSAEMDLWPARVVPVAVDLWALAAVSIRKVCCPPGRPQLMMRIGLWE